MGTVYNKNGGGGGAKVINLGTGTSFNVSGYSGYKNFTNDNFIVCAKASSSSVSQNCGSGNTVVNITPSASCNVSVNKSYNASTGVLTASETTTIVAGVTMYRDGNFSKTTSPVTKTNAVQVYLVIGKIS